MSITQSELDWLRQAIGRIEDRQTCIIDRLSATEQVAKQAGEKAGFNAAALWTSACFVAGWTVVKVLDATGLFGR